MITRAQEVIDLLEAASIQHIKDIAKELIDKFFSEYNLSVPDIKIRNNLQAGWVGRHSCTKVDRKGEIEIQKSIVDDDKTLRRVLAHELIHHWQCVHKMTDIDFNRHVYKAAKKADSGHGEDFEKWAAKINSVMGDNYVTKISDTDYVYTQDKEFFLLIRPLADGRMSYSFMQRPNQRVRQYLMMHHYYETTRIFKSSNPRFLRTKPFKVNGSFGVPADKEAQEELKRIYDSGKGIKFEV